MSALKDSWPTEAKEIAVSLHSLLSINHKNWHALKGNPDRRAAELFAGAIVQMLSDGDKADIIGLASQGILWLKGELKDPGCPDH